MASLSLLVDVVKVFSGVPRPYACNANDCNCEMFDNLVAIICKSDDREPRNARKWGPTNCVETFYENYIEHLEARFRESLRYLK